MWRADPPNHRWPPGSNTIPLQQVRDYSSRHQRGPDLKSGMPLEVEMPAPVNATTRSASLICEWMPQMLNGNGPKARS
jgi:hypothetical protein